MQSNIPKGKAGQYFVKLKRKYRAETDGGLYIDTSFEPNAHAEVEGIIASVPERGGIEGLSTGDEIGFSYLVVGKRDETTDGSMPFRKEPIVNPLIAVWCNGLGESVTRTYLMRDRYRIQRTVSINGNNEITDACEGNVISVNRWLENQGINIHEDADGITQLQTHYQNLVTVNGKEYWSVDSSMIHALKKGNKVVPVPGFVLCERLSKEEKLSGEWVKIVAVDGDSVLADVAGKPAFVEANKCTDYIYWGRDYLVVPESRVMAVRQFNNLAI